MSSKTKIIGSVVLAVVAIYAGLKMIGNEKSTPENVGRELSRDDLELREGDVLFVKGEEQPFSGKMVDYFPNEQKRSEIEVSQGKLNGLSRGWYENGQLEVEESFKGGVSHGVRIRWYQNGLKKSEANIVEGEIEGVFRKWHDNGQEAAKVTMVAGNAHGTSESWHRSGELKSRVVLEHGKVVEREFFEDRKLSQR